jgi:hypothetical protein
MEMAGASIVVFVPVWLISSLPVIKNRMASSGFAGYALNGGGLVVSSNENRAIIYSLIRSLNPAQGSMRLQIIMVLLSSKYKHLYSKNRAAVGIILKEYKILSTFITRSIFMLSASLPYYISFQCPVYLL